MALHRKIALFAFLALLLSLIFVFGVSALDLSTYGEVIESYTVSAGEGDHVTVTLYGYDEKYSLVVSGSGRMKEFSSVDEIPWIEYADRIVNVTVEKGVANLSELFSSSPKRFITSSDSISPSKSK